MSPLRFFVFLMGCGVFAVAASPRVALVVDAADGSAVAWQAVLTAELSRLAPEAELVERAELARAWTEREQAALAGIAAMPAPLGVDRYLHFRRVSETRWIVELVDAESGRALGAFAVGSAALEDAAALASAGARLLAAPPPAAPRETAPRLAVVESGDASGDGVVFGLAAHLRAAFADAGCVVLDRALTQEIVVEQNDASRGFRVGSPVAGLLALDFYLEVSPRDVRLLRVRDGVVLGVRPREAGGAREAEAIRRWASPLANVDRAAGAPDYLPQVETEALRPFYLGLAHYDAGLFADAAVEFTRAHWSNGRFREAYEWSARAHEALGLPEMASALRRYLATEFLENIHASTGRVAPLEGLAFLGVRAEEDLSVAARDLSVFAASALAAREELGLRLPDQLARLQREYDWMTGGDGVVSSSASALTRYALSGVVERGAGGGLRVRWILRDTLGRREPVRRETELAEAGSWPAVLRDVFAEWPAHLSVTPAAAGTRSAVSPANGEKVGQREIDALAARIIASDGLDAERLRLRLLQIAPEHPLCVAPPLGRLDRPLGDFVEQGRINHVLARLPAAHPQRRWLELRRALADRTPFPPARLFGHEARDTEAELARLVADDSADGAGLVARYALLFINQARLPAAELAERCERLRAEIRAAPAPVAEIEAELDLALASLARLARLAGAPSPADLVNLDDFQAPIHVPRLEWTAQGKLEFKVGDYAITRRFFSGLSGDETVAEARALLAWGGRGRAGGRYDSALLAAHPHSLALAHFVVLALDDLESPGGLPYSGGMEQGERRAYVRAGVDYAFAAFLHGFSRLGQPEALNRTAMLATALLGVLGSHDLREIVPVDDYETLHGTLVAAEEAARRRLPFRPHFNSNTLSLAEHTPAVLDEFYRDHLSDIEVWIASREAVSVALAERAARFAGATKPGEPANWWWLARRWETRDAMTAPARAALLARPLDDVLRLVSPAPDEPEAERLFDLGLFLLQGRRDADAERVLERLTATHASGAAGRRHEEIIANAFFRLAQTRRIAGRTPEAIEAARRGLELASGRHFEFYEHEIAYVYNQATLEAHLSRLLVELRHDPRRLDLPARTSFVQVPTSNGDNPRLTVFYRLPPPAAENVAGTPARRVLLIGPTNNQDPLPMLSGDTPWTRFADAHDLVLVAPRFLVSERSNRADHRFSHFRHAQLWSGEAVLQALERIGERTPLAAGRLLLYGQTSGGGFISHFAAWRPERVAAVALTNGNWTFCRGHLPGLAPAAQQRDMPYWIGANPHDNHNVRSLRPRYAFMLEFAARLRDLGARVEWTDWPSQDHTPQPGQEEAARAFLARQLGRAGQAAAGAVAPVGAVATDAAAGPSSRAAAGTIITLEFPELARMHDQQPAACEVSFPPLQDPSRPAPLFVWFGGGSGGHTVGGLRGLVDFDRFVVVALPYPGGVMPRLAAKESGASIDAHWAYQRAMLDRVLRLAPEIDPQKRFVAGTSSGGHHIAYGIDRGWPGFTDFFTHFVVHEGGADPLTEGFPNAKGKRMLVVYGEKSTSVVWRGWFNWNVHISGARADIIGIPGAGHGLNNDGRKVIRAWLDARASESE